MTDRTNIVTWVVDGKSYDVDLFDIDGIEWRDAKRATGMTQTQIPVAALGNGGTGDFEAVAALLWIVRRRQEPALTYEDVLGGLSIGRMLHEDETAEVTPDPPD